MTTIKINGIDYQLKYTIRGLFIFEKIADATFTGKSLLEYYILFYSILLANNQDTFRITFDEFLNECDNDSTLFPQFLTFLNKEYELQFQLKKEDEAIHDEGEDLKKK